jgi:hypothetical protein
MTFVVSKLNMFLFSLLLHNLSLEAGEEHRGTTKLHRDRTLFFSVVLCVFSVALCVMFFFTFKLFSKQLHLLIVRLS